MNYFECVNIIKNINNYDKIQYFLFKSKSCPFCDEWFKYNEIEFRKYLKNNFDFYIINCDNQFIPFPPLISPTSYFYHKNFNHPFIRQSMLPLLEMTKELNKFVRIKNGEKYEDVFQ
jgi:hypothetical protein